MKFIRFYPAIFAVIVTFMYACQSSNPDDITFFVESQGNSEGLEYRFFKYKLSETPEFITKLAPVHLQMSLLDQDNGVFSFRIKSYDIPEGHSGIARPLDDRFNIKLSPNPIALGNRHYIIGQERPSVLTDGRIAHFFLRTAKDSAFIGGGI